jgi:hypothetical protein
MRPTPVSSPLTLSRGISRGVPGRESNPCLPYSRPTHCYNLCCLLIIITSGLSQGVHSVELRYGAELPGALLLRVPVVPRLHRPLRPHPTRARLTLGQVRPVAQFVTVAFRLQFESPQWGWASPVRRIMWIDLSECWLVIWNRNRNAFCSGTVMHSGSETEWEANFLRNNAASNMERQDCVTNFV